MSNELRPGISIITAPKDEGLLSRRVNQCAEIAYAQGLRPFPTRFITVPAATMYELGAYGIPGRYGHWSRGRDYYRMKTLYDFGLSKIYELVINTNPSLAFLLETNPVTVNTVVAAHVLAHVDFFRNNPGFAHTNRQMAETALLSGDRVDSYKFGVGEEEVDNFLDAALSLEWNFDYYRHERPPKDEYLLQSKKAFDEREKRKLKPSSPFDDLLNMGIKRVEKPKERPPFPYEEEPDLFWFIANFSPQGLEDWQRDILEIIRSEGQYFLPQARTKIMNEGWATFWHVRVMRQMEELGYLNPDEGIEWAKMHAGVVSPGPMDKRYPNPYGLGWAVWKDIDRRYKGDTREGGSKLHTWWGDPKKDDKLPESVFDIRASVSEDQAFLANFLTPPLIDELEMFIYKKEGDNWVISERDPDKIKALLAQKLVNLGNPVIVVAPGGGDYNGNRELYLIHRRDSHDLDLTYATRVLANIYKLWGRAVHLETEVEDGKKLLLSCSDGKDVKTKFLI